ncbi:uncharacterized protein BJ212DRAFT_120078 [Suillus subaureus]|uniref:Uncharacterized protein n=1 Tax=Suillus subaureus TaxID=48587 RepID=A0A9P7ECT9_9AGAM|nr:uncharacterized protein BJ212DRAFT_120078 [Suillus subaureus]KAG1818010.1 hypothetical protein BJ212DRAFT_120078 [Suillus subaureus]
MSRYKVSVGRYAHFRDTIKQCRPTHSHLLLAFMIHSKLLEHLSGMNTCTLVMTWFYISFRLHAERQGSACPCYPIVQFVLDPLPFLHHWLSLPETQCHGSLSAIAGELAPYGDSTFNITTDTVEASYALDVGSPSLSSPSPMEPDFIHQSLLDTTLDTNTGMDALYLSGLDHLEGHNFNLEPFPEFSNSFLPELSMTPSMDHASSQMWSPHTLPQSPDTSSSNGSLYYDYTWTNEPAHDCFIDPLSYDIQPHVQNSSDVYLSSVCSGTDLDSLTSLWLDEGRSECAISMDDMGSTPSLCRWGDGSCTSLLTSDKSEVGKHLQVLHWCQIWRRQREDVVQLGRLRERDEEGEHITARCRNSFEQQNGMRELWKAVCSVGF